MYPHKSSKGLSGGICGEVDGRLNVKLSGDPSLPHCGTGSSQPLLLSAFSWKNDFSLAQKLTAEDCSVPLREDGLLPSPEH